MVSGIVFHRLSGATPRHPKQLLRTKRSFGLYSLHVLASRLGEWEYAREFVGYSSLAESVRVDARADQRSAVHLTGQSEREQEALRVRRRRMRRRRQRERRKRNKRKKQLQVPQPALERQSAKSVAKRGILLQVSATFYLVARRMLMLRMHRQQKYLGNGAVCKLAKRHKARRRVVWIVWIGL